ncbi:MAG TPA: hypothetical protein VFD94_09900 [Jatrophihabitans sp.]|jgi:DMSO/TMAO reductase YedYZ heme-binding membrane subunit|nr:hypothetical protein [Jatrophihabitans sp.]
MRGQPTATAGHAPGGAYSAGRGQLARAGRRLLRALAVAVSAIATGVLLGHAVRSVTGNRMAPWILARAAGVTSYLLMVALVLMGIALSHPWRSRVSRPSAASRIRIHVAFGLFTFGFTVLHIVVLATDRYAGVGWWGAFVPLGASYRPIPVTFGLIGLWLAILIGLTAALSGRLPGRAWWPLHKIATLSLVAIWIHAVLSGSDTSVLRPLYLSTALLVLAFGFSRYAARTAQDRRRELLR